VAVAKDWELHHVKNAFLHGDLEEEAYMKLDPRFKCKGENKIYPFQRSLYGPL